MEKLFELHDNYLARVPMDFFRRTMDMVNWDSRLIAIKGPKGVGKSTLLQQYIKLHFDPSNRHVLYCSADTSYFSSHTIIDTIIKFVQSGGTHIFIDEIHKYLNWSQELKEAYDLYNDLHIVVSGSSLLRINDGKADLSRRLVEYDMPGLSFREFLWFETGTKLDPITLEELLNNPVPFCGSVTQSLRPLEYFHKYCKEGYYPFYFDGRGVYQGLVENVVNYIIENELTQHRGLEVGNTRKVKALLQVLSQIVPYQVDISKLSRSIGIERPTTLKYLKNLEEAKLIKRLFSELSTISDLQKPDKILIDNPNLIYTLSNIIPDIGTVRESFLCNQLCSAGHSVEYGGVKSGDFRVDKKYVIEVGGEGKGYGQIKETDAGYIAADDIESAVFRKIPLWAFGFLY